MQKIKIKSLEPILRKVLLTYGLTDHSRQRGVDPPSLGLPPGIYEILGPPSYRHFIQNMVKVRGEILDDIRK